MIMILGIILILLGIYTATYPIFNSLSTPDIILGAILGCGMTIVGFCLVWKDVITMMNKKEE